MPPGATSHHTCSDAALVSATVFSSASMRSASLWPWATSRMCWVEALRSSCAVDGGKARRLEL